MTTDEICERLDDLNASTPKSQEELSRIALAAERYRRRASPDMSAEKVKGPR